MNNIKGTRQINSVTSGEGVFFKIYFKKNNKIVSRDCLIKTQDSAKL